MNDDIAIKVDHVSKKYCKSLKNSMLYGVNDIVRNSLGFSSHSERLRNREFWAVDDVSFELKKGETLGIIGSNGSGKTTLLKMLNGIFWPDKGKITIKGKVGALIEVGAGFHPLLTGRENIYLNGAILGMNRKEIDEKFDDIVEFADIGDFLDTPVKTYSSGMYVRLGFAVAVHCEPDILLVDEVLAVGDNAFQIKSRKKIGELKKRSSIILISHQMSMVQNICDRCIVLNRGKVIHQGNVIEAVSKYYSTGSSLELNDNKIEIQHANKGLEVRSLRIRKNGTHDTNDIFSGDSVEFLLEINCKEVIMKPHISLTFNGDIYTGYNTKYDSFNIDKIYGDSIISLKIRHFGLGAGIYDVSIGIWDSEMLKSYFWNWNAARIVVRSLKNYVGRFEFEHEWSFTSNIEK